MKDFNLKYGMNPHQNSAKIYSSNGEELPFKILNGNPGYINFMDALNSWQLVRELKESLKLPAAASFKHVSPAGAGVYVPLSDEVKKAYFLDEDEELTPLATAYVRARGGDRMSSFGDWVALSDEVDEATAKLMKKEVSDGVIAPSYSKEALKILKEKKNGKFAIIEIDEKYNTLGIEKREIFGITFEQERNSSIPNEDHLKNIQTNKKNLNEAAKRDMVLAMITLKYTQSNSICLCLDGQIIGCGAGQQSRIHCTRMASDKADFWYMRQHPKVLKMEFKKGIKRVAKDNAIDLYIKSDMTDQEKEVWSQLFTVVPEAITLNERKEWVKTLKNVSLGSDAYIPFRDNIDRAFRSGVKYIIQPGMSIRDNDVIKACDEYDILMSFSNLRLFHH